VKSLPLLDLAEGRKTRLRKAPLPRPKEIVLHMAVAKMLRDHALPSWQWCHIPSGEARDIRTAAKLKQMGVRRGWPDFLLVAPDGAIRCLELKRAGENLTDDQEAFQTWCIAHAVPYSVCRTIDEALAVLDAWSCLRITIGGAR
jgi:VRR-NUC domain